MNSQTSFVAQQVHIQQWADLIRAARTVHVK